MRITYDPDANAAYIYVKGKHRPGEVKEGVFCDLDVHEGAISLDFNFQGHLIGIEILGARKLLPSDVLAEAEFPGVE